MIELLMTLNDATRETSRALARELRELRESDDNALTGYDSTAHNLISLADTLATGMRQCLRAEHTRRKELDSE